MRPFRFSISRSVAASSAEWRDHVRRADAAGYDCVMVADHLGAMEPFAALAAAAEISSTIRLGTYVINNDLLNPALLARAAASVDLLSDGRFELGIGAGWNQPEYVASGIHFERPSTRIARLDAALKIVGGLFAGETVTRHDDFYDIVDHTLDPLPPQGAQLPILVGGNGDRLLAVAASHASIVGLTGFRITAEGADASAATTDGAAERIGYVGSIAGDAADLLEWNVLVQRCVVTDDRAGAARELAAEWAADGMSISANDLLDSPFVLLGSVDEIVEQLQSIRARTGISYYSIHDRTASGFEPVVASLAGT